MLSMRPDRGVRVVRGLGLVAATGFAPVLRPDVFGAMAFSPALVHLANGVVAAGAYTFLVTLVWLARDAGMSLYLLHLKIQKRVDPKHAKDLLQRRQQVICRIAGAGLLVLSIGSLALVGVHYQNRAASAAVRTTLTAVLVALAGDLMFGRSETRVDLSTVAWILEHPQTTLPWVLNDEAWLWMQGATRYESSGPSGS